MGRKLWTLLVVVCSSVLGWSQGAEPAHGIRDFSSIAPVDRIVLPIANDQRVVLHGQRHPMARPEFSIGEASPELYLGKMILVLRGDDAQEAALGVLIDEQHDAASPYYHRWMTPREFGQKFGVSQHDINRVTAWLASFGMKVEEIPASRRAVIFSGTAEQVSAAFHTSMQKYMVRGVEHYANATDPEIPAALAPVVRGVAALHDFRSVPQHVTAPQYTASNGAHFLMPQDWVTIYDVAPLYNQGLDGSGQSIAVLGRVDVALSDVRTFRTNAGLPANDPQMIVNGADPGFPDCDDEAESALDVEWAGAIAKNATVKFVTSQSTTSADGISLSAQYAVNHNVAPIVSLSYGLCEAALGSGGNAFWNATWQQAAAQGMSVFVASGDNGAAGCDSPSETTAVDGRGVNGLCSSPYSTCVGGTQFNDTTNAGEYWSSANGSGMASALSYIPESVWNESSWSGGLWAGGGGTSIVYSKPSWQAAPGVPADGMRDVPDIALHASIQDAYVIQIQGSTFYVSGTSAATPSMASVMAMVIEKAGVTQGNANPAFYTLASQQLSSAGTAAFHDVTGGNNSVPGVSGFSAGTGYDEATGLGSVDASLLVNNWSSSKQSAFTLTPNVTSVALAPGGSAKATLALVDGSGFNSPVTLGASGAPAGVTVKFSSTTVTPTAPVTVTFSATSTAANASGTVTITGSGGGISRTAQVGVTVVAPSFTLTPSATIATAIVGTPAPITFTTAAANGFKSGISFSVSGLPKGVTGTFSPTSIASPGNGTSKLTFTVSSTATSGTATVTVKATGGGVTATQNVALAVEVPTFTLATGAASASVTAGSTKSMTVTTTVSDGFKSAISLSASGLPKGVTAKFSPTSMASPGNGTSTLTLTAASTTLGGTYTVTVGGSGGGVSASSTVKLTVVGPNFTLGVAGTKVNVPRGGSIPLTVSTSGVNGFSAAVTLVISGLPKGVTATFAPASIASPGTGSSTLTLKAASTAVSGTTATATITASGGGAANTATLTVAVQ